MPNCPCDSTKNDNTCCNIYINGHSNPDTPEKLMRSRYTAYTQGNIDYILRTMSGSALKNFTPESAKQWTTSVEWIGLEIIHSTIETTKGYVEFIAHYYERGEKKFIHEISEFHLINGQWYYVDGKYEQSKPYTKLKIGRNNSCPCGSGKKYKTCCLNKVCDS